MIYQMTVFVLLIFLFHINFSENKKVMKMLKLQLRIKVELEKQRGEISVKLNDDHFRRCRNQPQTEGFSYGYFLTIWGGARELGKSKHVIRGKQGGSHDLGNYHPFSKTSASGLIKE